MAVSFAPYLNFPGTAREAIEFYAGIFGGTPDIATFGAFNAVPAEHAAANHVMHAALLADDVHLYFSDHIAEMGDPPVVGENITLALMGDDDATLRRYWDALSEGGTVTVPLEMQMWGDTYGALTDRFGIHWQIDIGAAESPGA